MTKAPLLKSALDWAAIWHKDQVRKYPDVQVPYVSHIAGVAAILSRHGFAEDVVAAGALHDVLEDCGVSFDTLKEKFGEAVTAVVVMRPGFELTDDVVGEIQAAVKERKGSVQVPKKVLAADAIPMTALGKPDKKALRAQFN